jgi:3-hydroxyisobutyrate dehydrogenase
MELIGFIGLGTIGGVVARSIQKAGYSLVVCDIVPEQRGLWFHPALDSRRRRTAVARDCRIVFTSLPGPREVETVAWA